MAKKGYEERVAVMVRVPISLHRKILLQAKLARLTPPQYCERLLTNSLTSLLIPDSPTKKGDQS